MQVEHSEVWSMSLHNSLNRFSFLICIFYSLIIYFLIGR